MLIIKKLIQEQSMEEIVNDDDEQVKLKTSFMLPSCNKFKL